MPYATDKTVPRKELSQVISRTNYLYRLNDPYRHQKDQIRSLMNGGRPAVEVLLKGLETNDNTLPAANHIKSGVERFSEMISPTPDLRIDPPTGSDKDRDIRAAEKRERIVSSYDERCRIEHQLAQASLWLPGYGFYSWKVCEAKDRNGYRYPKAELRDPYTCIDTETEVLTKRGWLRHDEITEDDVVAGYDLDTGLARWTDVHGITRHVDYDDTIVRVEQRDLSMWLTKGHRCVVAHRHRDGTRGEVKVKFAEDLAPNEFIPRAADWEESGEKSIGVDLAALLGWVSAEGSYSSYDTVTLCQSLSANPEKVEQIDGIIGRLEGVYPGERNGRAKLRRGLSSTRRKVRTREGTNGEHTMVEWRLPLGLGQEVRRLMPDKHIGMWAMELPSDERDAMLQAFIDGDGHRCDSGDFIVQNDGETIHTLQAIAVTLGYKASLRKQDSRSTMTLSLYRSRWSQMRTRSVPEHGIHTQHHKGEMWCPTTGTGTFFARRNGYVFITGNSYPSEWGVDQRPQDIAYQRFVDPDTLAMIYPHAKSALEAMSRNRHTARLGGGAVDLSTFSPNARHGNQTPGWDGVTGGVEVIEYVDGWGTYVYSPAIDGFLDRYEHPLDRPPFTVPRRFTFDSLHGHFDDVIGLASVMAKLTLLTQIVMEDAAFAPVIVNGRMDGPFRKGQDAVNHIEGGDAKYLTQNVPYQMFTEIDRIEKHLRQTTGYSQQADGESPMSFVTGQGLEELGSSLSRQVERYQLVIGDGLEEIDSIRLEWDERAYGGQTRFIEGTRKGASYSEEYDPATDIGGRWRTSRVYGIMAGLDEARRTVGMLQLLAAEVIDVQTVQENLSNIDNAPKVRDRILSQKIENTQFEMLSAIAGQGDPSAMQALVQIKKDPKRMNDILEEFFKEPEEEEPAGPPGAAPPSEQEQMAQVLTRLTSSGAPQGGAQTLREVAGGAGRPAG